MAAVLLAAGNAVAATGVDPDLLTVSGRAALPSGEATQLAVRIEVGEVTLDPGVATAAGLKPDDLQSALAHAAAKTLKNYGYRPAAAVSADGGLTVALDVEPLEVTPDDKGDKVVAHIKVTATGASACFPYEATGEFHALTALRTGGGQKTLAIFLVVASAAAGYAAPGLLMDQWRSADEQQAAINAKRIVGRAEGVAPPGGQDVVVRYGAISALQLALASLVAHLGEPGGCNAADAPPALTQASAAAAQPVAAGAPGAASPSSPASAPASAAPNASAASNP